MNRFNHNPSEDLAAFNVEQAIVDHLRPDNGLVLFNGPIGSGNHEVLSYGLSGCCERIDFQQYRDGSPSCPVLKRNHSEPKPDFYHAWEPMEDWEVRICLEIAARAEAPFYTNFRTSSVAETLLHLMLFFPGVEARPMAETILNTLRLIVCQITLPSAAEDQQVACREYLVIDENLRSRLLQHEPHEWPYVATKLMANDEVTGATLLQSATRLFEKGAIHRNALEEVREQTVQLLEAA